MTEVLGSRGVVDTARLIWAARAEASRLHRLEVEAARHQAHLHKILDEADARIYRCPGCGEWRYRGNNGRAAYQGARITCAACGEHQDHIVRRSA